jgi:hypothetical protein
MASLDESQIIGGETIAYFKLPLASSGERRFESRSLQSARTALGGGKSVLRLRRLPSQSFCYENPESLTRAASQRLFLSIRLPVRLAALRRALEAVPAGAAEDLRGFTRAVDAQACGHAFAE